MYNVNFGDFFKIDTDNDILINDCGDLLSRRGISNEHLQSILHARCELCRTEKQSVAIITHFHPDHVNGFTRLSQDIRKFSKVIVPYISYDKHTKNYILVRLAVFCYTFLPSRSINRLFANHFLHQIDLIRDLCDNNSTIYFTSRGDEHRLNDITLKVLWPPKLINYNTPHKCNYLIEKIMYFENMYLSEELRRRYNKIIEELYEIFRQLNGQFRIENIAEINDNIDIHVKHLINIRNQLNLNYSFYDMSGIRDIVNALSLVYEIHPNITTTDDNNSVLMTGDISPEIIDRYICRSTNRHYKMLKAPHHGTNHYYTPNLPNADICLIPHGKSYYKWRIRNDYCQRYPQVFCCNGTNSCSIARNTQTNSHCVINSYMTIPI